jgi:hypothetical protein
MSPWAGLIVVAPGIFAVYPYVKDAIRAPRVPPDGWRLEETGTRWHLRWRPPLTELLGIPSLYRLISSPKVRAAVQAVFVVGQFACLWLLLTERVDLFGSYAVCIGLCVSLLGNAWCFEDFRLNRERDGSVPGAGGVAVEESQGLIVEGNVFPPSCFSSLKVIDTGARAGRKSIVFESSGHREIVVVGRPGVSEQTGFAIRDALLARVASASQEYAEESRTKRSSGLAIKSVGVDNPLVASR